MRTKHTAKKLAKQLTEQGIPAVDLHGNLSQPARDRNLAAFGDGSVRVLVATDVAARGVHVDDIKLVIHVDPPMEHKAYLHRSGRTARAGAAGDVVTLVLPEQRRDTADLLRKAAIRVQPQQVTSESAAVTSLIGDVAPRVAADALPEVLRRQPEGGGRSQGANAQRKQANRGQEHGGARQHSRNAGADGAPSRRDRSGRPATSSGGRGAGGAAQRSGESRASAPSQDRSAQPSARNEQNPSRPRGGKGRAQTSGGPIRVGQVVRQNTRGR
jgi:superfamily II DNA/RNA helicase